MYKKIYEQGRGENKHLIHLWTDEGYEKNRMEQLCL
jgi:hypothetical protein